MMELLNLGAVPAACQRRNCTGDPGLEIVRDEAEITPEAATVTLS
jgi:hypothetical protein